MPLPDVSAQVQAQQRVRLGKEDPSLLVIALSADDVDFLLDRCQALMDYRTMATGKPVGLNPAAAVRMLVGKWRDEVMA